MADGRGSFSKERKTYQQVIAEKMGDYTSIKDVICEISHRYEVPIQVAREILSKAIRNSLGDDCKYGYGKNITFYEKGIAGPEVASDLSTITTGLVNTEKELSGELYVQIPF